MGSDKQWTQVLLEVGRRFRCTMRVDCSQLDPGTVIRLDPGEWHPRMPGPR